LPWGPRPPLYIYIYSPTLPSAPSRYLVHAAMILAPLTTKVAMPQKHAHVPSPQNCFVGAVGEASVEWHWGGAHVCFLECLVAPGATPPRAQTSFQIRGRLCLPLTGVFDPTWWSESAVSRVSATRQLVVGRRCGWCGFAGAICAGRRLRLTTKSSHSHPKSAPMFLPAVFGALLVWPSWWTILDMTA
jgi:hypothetical protein